MNAFPELFLANGIVTNRIRFSHLRVTSGEWARGSRTTLTRKINDTLPRLPHHVFQCCLLSGLLNGPVTGAWAEKRATMPSHRRGFGVSTAGFLSLQENPPQRRFASKNSGAQLASVPTPRRDHATRGAVTTARVESGSGTFFERRPAHLAGRGIARVPPALDVRLAPRRSRDERGAPYRRDPVRDARQRAEAVRRRKLQGDVRQARAGPRPLQGASRSASRSVPMSDSRTRSSASDPRVAPSSSRRARRRAVVGTPTFSKKPRAIFSCAISSRQRHRLNSRRFPHAIPQEGWRVPTRPPSSPAARTSSSTTPASRPTSRTARNN